MISLFREPKKKLIILLDLSLALTFFSAPAVGETRVAETKEISLRVIPVLNAQLGQAMGLFSLRN